VQVDLDQYRRLEGAQYRYPWATRSRTDGLVARERRSKTVRVQWAITAEVAIRPEFLKSLVNPKTLTVELVELSKTMGLRETGGSTRGQLTSRLRKQWNSSWTSQT
jgi:hypothetical protein